jgi:hypothetical protein
MRSASVLITFAVMLLGACKPAEQPEPRAEPESPQVASPAPTPTPAPEPTPIDTTINQFFGRGTPSFVVGTAGDDVADRAIVGQVALIRDAVFPSAEVVADASVDAGAWPTNAVLYGGPHVNSLLAELELPFELEPGRLQIGDRTFEGTGYQLIAVVPAGARHPEFLLYAGTGTPGIAEINGVKHGPESIVVIDAFGRLTTGAWVRTADGLRAELADPAPRIEWRTIERELGVVHARVSFPKQLAPDEDEAELVDAAGRGVTSAVEYLGITTPMVLDVYVYPDRRSKQSLTGNEGDGHAVPMARTLHVLRNDPGALERLLAHEATHVLAYEAWGPAGSVLFGEGLAVVVSGQYGGTTLDEWAQRLDTAPAITELLGPGFRKRPEAETYPAAGLVVAAAIEQVGIDQVRTHLYGATAQGFAEACERAGTSADALADALAKSIAR